jgi:hypothetical protein
VTADASLAFVLLLQIQIYCWKDSHSDIKILTSGMWRRVLW